MLFFADAPKINVVTETDVQVVLVVLKLAAASEWGAKVAAKFSELLVVVVALAKLSESGAEVAAKLSKLLTFVAVLAKLS